MSILKEFKEFALRGNMVDMAIGLVIGAAFTGVVNSLVDDVIMPPLGLLLGGVDFSDFSLILRDDPKLVLNYGAFISRCLDFVILAFVVFMVIKGMNRLAPKKRVEPTMTSCLECCMEIPIKAKLCGHCGATRSPSPAK